jgi:hypothetical protein
MLRTLVRVLLSLCLLASVNAETIRLAVAEQLYHAQLPWIEKMHAAMALAGYELELVPLPGKRALMEANEGHHHGDAFRGTFVQPQAPNLVPIQVPVDYFPLYAWSIYGSAVTQHEELDNLSPIGLMGFRYFDHLSPVVNNPVYMLADIESVQRVLENREDTFFVATEAYRQGLITQGTVQADLWVKLHNSPIKSFPVFAFLHKDHQALIPELEAAFAQVFTDNQAE